MREKMEEEDRGGEGREETKGGAGALPGSTCMPGMWTLPCLLEVPDLPWAQPKSNGVF